MASIKSLNSVSKKIVKKGKSTAQRETFFGKSFDANEQQFDNNALAETGPYLAKVIYIYGKVTHDNWFSGMLSAVGSWFGIGDDSVADEGVMTVKARLVDNFDAAIPEPELTGEAVVDGAEKTKGKSAILVDMHDTFVALSKEANNLELKVGDLIIVDYRDKKNKKNGYIISKHWSSETEADRAKASGANADKQYTYPSDLPAPKVTTRVTNPTKGKCGRVFVETDCSTSGTKVKGTYRFGPYPDLQSATNIKEILDKLSSAKVPFDNKGNMQNAFSVRSCELINNSIIDEDECMPSIPEVDANGDDVWKTKVTRRLCVKQENGSYKAPEDQSQSTTDQQAFGYSAEPQIFLDVTYDWTSRMDYTKGMRGHPDFIIMVKLALDNLAKHYVSLMDPIPPSLIMCGSDYRSNEEQISLRRANCLPPKGTLTEAELPTGSSSKCDPHTAAPGSSQHERGEAIDFSLISEEKLRQTQFEPPYYYINFNQAAVPEGKSQPVRIFLAQTMEFNLTQYQSQLVTKDCTIGTFIQYVGEWWHFSTNGN